jgi:hypothetical protein
MKTRFDNYRRLARGLFSCSSLWVSESNVLYVCGAGVLLPFAEEYHRFDLRRIQSVSLVRTYTGLVLSVIFIVILLGFGGVAAVALVNAAGSQDLEEFLYYLVGVPSAVLSLLALGLLIVNILLGPTCQFQIQTPARLQRVRSVRRMRVGRRVLAELAPMLTRAQGVSGASPDAMAPPGPIPQPVAVEPMPG